MLKSANKTETNIYTLEVSISGEDFKAAILKAYNKQKGNIAIPGFRKGKVPLHMIERYYGKGVFYEDALDILYPDVVSDAIKEAGIEAVAAPHDLDVSKIDEDGVEMSMKVTVKPEIEVSEYKGLKAVKADTTVSAAEVKKQLQDLQERNARVITVEDRAVKKDDIAVIDFEGFVDGVAFDGGKGEDFELTIGSGQFIPGFEDQIIGHNTGDEFDVNVKFPKEYTPELADKDAVFKVKVKEIKAKELPELDDEFAKDVSEYDTLEELKKANRERLEAYAKAGSESQMKDAALGKVVEANEVDVPGTMVEDEMDRMCQELDQQLRYQGMSLEQYLQFTGKDMAAFRNELRPDAERQVKTRIILMGIVEAEGIKVSQEEMEEELKVMAAQYQTTADKLKEMIGVENLTFLMKDLQVKKAIELIFENAVIK